MLLRVQLDTPEPDSREPMGSALREPTYVWIEHTAILSIQKGRPGAFKFVLANGLTFPAKGDADDFARRVNQAHQAYMSNPGVFDAANDAQAN